MSDQLLSVSDLRKSFRVPGGRGDKAKLCALDGINLELGRGETLGLVGESGCGKSTLGRLLVGLEAPSAGEVRFAGEVLRERRTPAQRRRIQMVFQDPYSSLNPRMSVCQTL